MSSRRIVLRLSGLSLDEAVHFASRAQGNCNAVIVDECDEEREVRIRSLRQLIDKVIVNVKLCGEPEAAAEHAAKIIREGADIILVHAGRGVAMMKAVAERLKKTGRRPVPELWAVITLPPWMSDEEVAYNYDNRTTDQIVLDHAFAATRAGAEGLVCLPQDIWNIRKNPDCREMRVATTGINPTREGINDEVGTLAQAIHDGANFIIVDRQTVGNRNPMKVFNSIAAEINVNFYADKQGVCPRNTTMH